MNSTIDHIRKSTYIFKKQHPRLVMTILVFVIIPLVVSLILGYEMGGNLATSIPTVVVDHDNSDFSRDYLRYIDENQFFNIVEYADEDERVQEMMNEGKAFVGVIIPENFYSDMREGKAPKILNFYDGSAMAVVTVSKSSMTKILMTVKSAYMMKIYEGKQNVVPNQVMNQVVPINLTCRNLFNPTKNFRNFILPGMLAGLVQVGLVIMGAERGWENQRNKISFIKHGRIILGWSLMGAVSLILCLLVQYLFFSMPYKGTILGGLLLTILFSICITTLGYTIGSFFSDRTFATQVSCILVLPTTILGGYTWPVLGMPLAFQELSKVIPFTYYGQSIRELCLRQMEFHQLIPEMLAMVGFTLFGAFVLLVIKRLKSDYEEVEEDDWEVMT